MEASVTELEYDITQVKIQNGGRKRKCYHTTEVLGQSCLKMIPFGGDNLHHD